VSRWTVSSSSRALALSDVVAAVVVEAAPVGLVVKIDLEFREASGHEEFAVMRAKVSVFSISFSRSFISDFVEDKEEPQGGVLVAVAVVVEAAPVVSVIKVKIDLEVKAASRRSTPSSFSKSCMFISVFVADRGEPDVVVAVVMEAAPVVSLFKVIFEVEVKVVSSRAYLKAARP